MLKRPPPEKEYFGKLDIIKKRKIADAKKLKLAKSELEKLKNLHWRHCANCGLELEEIIFKGVVIYKCFNCESVFLEGGVLERLCGEESNFFESLMDLFKF